MAVVEMKVPSPGESISEVQIARWIKNDGDFVEKDEEICEIDSDKATLTINAESSGTLKTNVKEGDTIAVGAVICSIDTAGVPTESKVKKEKVAVSEKTEAATSATSKTKSYASGTPSVSAEKILREKGIDTQSVNGTGRDGRITKADAENASAVKNTSSISPSTSGEQFKKFSRELNREKMSMLRKKVSQRLVSVKQETAMLTTFNEVDMWAIMNIRNQYKEKFKDKYGVGLGFMSFFTSAVCKALRLFPAVNAQIDGDEIVYHQYCDIGIAVSAPKGLMVPVLRNAESLSFAEIESKISELAGKARDGKISLEEMTGGTFTITNGGVFGSMLSTPIINPPQSAILGMHNIVERPVAINGKVVIRPIMYVALSYDHRIIDGRESVGFLVKVKQMLENPALLLTDGEAPEKRILAL